MWRIAEFRHKSASRHTHHETASLLRQNRALRRSQRRGFGVTIGACSRGDNIRRNSNRPQVAISQAFPAVKSPLIGRSIVPLETTNLALSQPPPGGPPLPGSKTPFLFSRCRPNSIAGWGGRNGTEKNQSPSLSRGSSGGIIRYSRRWRARRRGMASSFITSLALYHAPTG